MEQMNYTLGRGELYFNKFKPGTQVGMGERYIGNTPAATINVQSDNLDHYNSDRGVKEKDASVVLQTNRTGSFTTDHIAPENLALFFFGSVNALTVAAATALAISFDAVHVGYFYQLGESAAHPTGDRNVTNVVLTDDKTPTPTPLVLGTDYMLNAELGRIEILDGPNIVDGTTNIRGTYDVQASTRELIMSGTTPVEGSLRYIAQNPVGRKIDYFMPWVKLSPNGDFALKGDEWQQIPFNIEILRRTGYEAIYADGRALTA
jgi:hypothetical protein